MLFRRKLVLLTFCLLTSVVSYSADKNYQKYPLTKSLSQKENAVSTGKQQCLITTYDQITHNFAVRGQNS